MGAITIPNKEGHVWGSLAVSSILLVAAYITYAPDEFTMGIWWVGFMFGTFIINPDTFSDNPIHRFKHHGASHNVIIWVLVAVGLVLIMRYFGVGTSYEMFILGWFSNGLLHIIMDFVSMVFRTTKNNFFKF